MYSHKKYLWTKKYNYEPSNWVYVPREAWIFTWIVNDARSKKPKGQDNSLTRFWIWGWNEPQGCIGVKDLG